MEKYYKKNTKKLSAVSVINLNAIKNNKKKNVMTESQTDRDIA